MHTRNFFQSLDKNRPNRLIFQHGEQPKEQEAPAAEQQNEALQAVEAANTQPEAIAAALEAGRQKRAEIGSKIEGIRADNRGWAQRKLGDLGAGIDRFTDSVAEKAKAAKDDVTKLWDETVADLGLTGQAFLEMVKAVGGDLGRTVDSFKEMAGAVADDLLATKDSFMEMMAAVGQTREWEILVGMGGKVMDAAIKYGYELPKEAINILIADGAELADDTIKFFKENGTAFVDWADKTYATSEEAVTWALKECKRVYYDVPKEFVTDTIPRLAENWTGKQLAELAGVWAKTKEEYNEFAKLCGDKYDEVVASAGEMLKDVKKGLIYAKDCTAEGLIATFEFAKEHGYDIPKDFYFNQLPLYASNWTDKQLSKITHYYVTELKIPVENWTEEKKQQMVAAIRAGEKAWNGFLNDMEKEGEKRLGRNEPQAPEQQKDTFAAGATKIEGGTLEFPVSGKVAVDGLRFRSGPNGNILGAFKTGETVNFEPQSAATLQVVGDVTWRKIKGQEAWVAVKKGKQNYINS